MAEIKIFEDIGLKDAEVLFRKNFFDSETASVLFDLVNECLYG